MSIGDVRVDVADTRLAFHRGVGPYLLAGSLVIRDRVEERSTCSFTVVDPVGEWDPARGQPITIAVAGGAGGSYYGSGTYGRSVYGGFPEIIFTGFIDAVVKGLAIPGTTEWQYEIACVDNHYLADKRIVARSYQEETCGAIVEDLLTRYLADEGVTAGTIEAGPTIAEAIFNYVYVDEALDALVERAGFTWRIDSAKQLHFHARTADPAPWNIDETTVLRLGTSWGLSIDDSNPEYRNRQYIRGGKDVTDPQVESRIGDGETRAFTMSYPLAEVPTITLNASEQTVGIRGVDTGKDWYWNKGDPVISQDVGGTVLEDDDTLTVTYVGEFNIVVLVEDPVAIADRRAVEGVGTGYVEAVFDAAASSRDAAFDLAKAKLARYGIDGDTLTFETRKTGLHAGHLLTADLDGYPFDGQSFLVTSVTTVDEAPQVLRRSVTAVRGPVLQSWTRLLAPPASSVIDLLNVGGGEVLALLVSTSETATWAEDVDQAVYACPVISTGLLCGEDVIVC